MGTPPTAAAAATPAFTPTPNNYSNKNNNNDTFESHSGLFPGDTSRNTDIASNPTFFQGHDLVQLAHLPLMSSSSDNNVGLPVPKGAPTPVEMDRIIAQEMTGLSIQERENAENDVHGISASGEENPLFVESCLLQMNRHLQQLKLGTVYQEAEEMKPSYVNDRALRLKFLRADRYSPKEAAERMIRFFDLKKSLFGSEKLVKEITLLDLSADDMETMRSGYMQVSPCKDMVGRSIVVGMLKLRKIKVKDNASRVAFYMFMSMVETEEEQKLGVVCVYYLLDASNLQSVTGKLRSCVPVHFVSLHLCYNDITQYALTCMGVYALSQRTKVRFRPHYGSHLECQYALTTFGIPREALPVSTDGTTSTQYLEAWLAARLAIDTEREKAMSPRAGTPLDSKSEGTSSSGSVTSQYKISWSSPTSASAVPQGTLEIQPNDVLFGRGKTVVEHPGNLRFRSIVGVRMEEYEAASRLEKTCMTENIVQLVKDANGRFLKRDDGGDWEEVDDETARKKVAHAFRNRRKFHGAI